MQFFNFAIATQLAQALASLALAALMWLFLRARRRRPLRHLTLAFAALAVYLAAGAGALAVSQHGDPLGLLRQSLSVIALGALFPHLVWLWLGITEGTRLRPRRRGLEQRLVVVGALTGLLMGLGAAWLATRGATAIAHGLRVTLPYCSGGLVYLSLATVMYRARHQAEPEQLSPPIGMFAFSAFGLYLLYSAALSSWMVSRNVLIAHSQFVGLIGLLLLMMIALSIVIWLLENEQRRASSALDQARSAEQRLLYFRTHDAATGLPNRRQLQDVLRRELHALDPESTRRVAVLALGIHRFKEISEAVGWRRTEDMMRDLSQRLRSGLPGRFTLGRIGERDFAIVMPDIRHRDKAIEHAREILERARRPFQHRDQELVLKVSGGLSLGLDDAGDAVDLIKFAESAQLQAAAVGEEILLHRAAANGGEPRDILQIEGELRRAQKEGQFRLYYQPLISIRHRRIAGFEALLRWEHPERGLLNPDYFLQDASSLGVLDQIEDHIFASALAQLADWHSDLALAPVSVSINVSAQRFLQPDLPERLVAVCRKHGVSPSYLDIEITENAAIEDFEAGLDTIGRLREKGIKVSLDDFGTGYSSLAQLQRLNVDYVKLDRGFVNGIETDSRQLALTRAIVDLIHSLGMQVLVEGVETRAQLGQLIHCRVDFVQGYLLGPPRPAEDCRSLLERKEITIF